MVCPRCTLLHNESVLACQQCGYEFRSMLRQMSLVASQNSQVSIGIISGASLVTCMAVALLEPVLAGGAFMLGAYFALASIGNSCIAAFRGNGAEWLRGPRGILFGVALIYSLTGELARMQGIEAFTIPSFGGVGGSFAPPSALVTEFLAAVLIVFDPLLAQPLLRWIDGGVQRVEPVTLELRKGEQSINDH